MILTKKPPAATTDDIRLLSPASRKSALSQRLLAPIKNVIVDHNLPQEHIQKVTNTLLKFDLGLIPLLHDSQALETKILQVLQALTGGELTVGQAGVLREHVAVLGLGVGFEEVADVLLAALPGAEIVRCLEDRTLLEKHCETAKRVISQRSKQDEANEGDIDVDVPLIAEYCDTILSAQSSDSVQSSDITTNTQEDHPTSTDITIEYLSQLPFREIITILRQEGPTIFDQLGIQRLPALEIGNLLNFIQRINRLSGEERRIEVIKKVAERVGVCLSFSSFLCFYASSLGGSLYLGFTLYGDEHGRILGYRYEAD